MRNPSGKAILVWLVILAPAPVLAFANIRRWIAGRGFEPWEDNLIMYFLLEGIFGAAAFGLTPFVLLNLTIAHRGGTFSPALLLARPERRC